MSYNAQFVEALKEALNGLRTIHAVGEEWCSYIGQIPTGGVPYCGQEVTRSTYSALWQYAQAQGLVKTESEWQSIATSQNGNVPFYSEGNGSSTFRMPRLVGYVRGASGQSEAGAYVKEGLPNITGSMRSDPIYGIIDNADKETCLSGAFVGGERIDNGAAGSKDIYGAEVLFDASRSNSIYGNSDHVTPETSVVLFGVYAFGEVNNVDALDAGTLASALAKVESNIASLQSKAPYAYVTEVWSNGSNWYRKYSDGWIEQGGILVLSSAVGNTTHTLNVPFSNTNYLVLLMGNDSGTPSAVDMMGTGTKTTTSFVSRFLSTSSSGLDTNRGWYACGY